MRKLLFSLFFLVGGFASEISQSAGRPCAMPSASAAPPLRRRRS
ncbi:MULTISPECIES: hypothetical protein [unclassified Variovorax]|nr:MULTISPECIES: hypothetical protein [unclassified Variovorax]